MRWMPRAVHSPLAATALAAAAAFLAALGAFIVRLIATGKYHYLDLVVDVIRNVLIAGLVGAGTAWLAESRRQADERATAMIREEKRRVRVQRLALLANHAGTAWNTVPGLDVGLPSLVDALDELRRSAAELHELATKIDKVHEADLRSLEGRLALLPLLWPLYGYVAEGMRTRRFERLDRLAEDVRQLADDDAPEWSACAATFRQAAVAATGWRSHTDTVILERLVVERSLDGASLEPQDDAHREMLSASTVDTVVVAVEPVFLLIGHIAVHSESIHEEGNPAASAVKRCLGALRNETEMIARAQDALIDVLSLFGPASPKEAHFR